MLVAELNDARIEAEFAERGRDYRCPRCKRPVIPKLGPIVIRHFAHKPPTDCAWAAGETLGHLRAKRLIADALGARGLVAMVECVMPHLDGDRRADVMVTTPRGGRIALELQHTNIGLENLHRRAFSYAKSGTAQFWIPFLRASALARAEPRPGGDGGDLFIRRYAPRQCELWAYGFADGEIWYYDPATEMLWQGCLYPHMLRKGGREWFDQDGEEHYEPPYLAEAKLLRDLVLWGPYSPGELRIVTRLRPRARVGPYDWPAGRYAKFVASGLDTGDGDGGRTGTTHRDGP